MASALNLSTLSKVANALVPQWGISGIPAIKLGVSIPQGLLPEWLSQEQDQQEISDSKDDGILKAAPKKKVSHMKRRQRLYGPGDKHVKLQNNLNRCPACGHYKRSHTLCMNCVNQIRHFWKKRDANNDIGEPEDFANPRDEQILYPGKTVRDYEKKLKDDSWWHKRAKTLPVE